MDAALAAINDAAGLVLDRGDVLGADVAVGIYPHRGDASGAKVVFREELVARWLAHAQSDGHHIRAGGVKHTNWAARSKWSAVASSGSGLV
jgi:hypothetical protein